MVTVNKDKPQLCQPFAGFVNSYLSPGLGESCGHIGHRMVSLLRITHHVLFSRVYMMNSCPRLQTVDCICFSNDDKY